MIYVLHNLRSVKITVNILTFNVYDFRNTLNIKLLYLYS